MVGQGPIRQAKARRDEYRLGRFGEDGRRLVWRGEEWHGEAGMSKFTQAANRESCIACGRSDETVVLAHRNEGKAMGKKLIPDWLGLDLCYGCHTAYDQGNKMTRDEKRMWFNEQYPKQITRWIDKGILK